MTEACPICGKSYKEIRESRPCPLHGGAIICATEHCLNCEYLRSENQAGFIWCTYHLKHPSVKRERQIENLKRRIRMTSNDIRELYRRNYTNKAKQRELDLMKLTAELRRIENK